MMVFMCNILEHRRRNVKLFFAERGASFPAAEGFVQTGAYDAGGAQV
jgi:hypothetical protein